MEVFFVLINVIVTLLHLLNQVIPVDCLLVHDLNRLLTFLSYSLPSFHQTKCNNLSRSILPKINLTVVRCSCNKTLYKRTQKFMTELSECTISFGNTNLVSIRIEANTLEELIQKKKYNNYRDHRNLECIRVHVNPLFKLLAYRTLRKGINIRQILNFQKVSKDVLNDLQKLQINFKNLFQVLQ